MFAVATSLHLAQKIPLTSRSLSQSHATKARSELAKRLCSETAVMISAVFQDCFPLLCVRRIDDAAGVEIVNNGEDASTRPTLPHRRSTRSTNPILLKGDGLSSSTAIALCWQEDIVSINFKLNDAKGKKRDHHEICSSTTNQDKHANNKKGTMNTSYDEDTNASNKGGTTKTSEGEDASNKDGTTMTSEYEDASNKGGSTMTSDDEDKKTKEGTQMTCQDDANNKQMTADTTLYRIIHNVKVECFKDLDYAFPFIEDHKRATGNWQRIQQSVLDKYCVHRCCSHVNCPFLVRFSRQLSMANSSCQE